MQANVSGPAAVLLSNVRHIRKGTSHCTINEAGLQGSFCCWEVKSVHCYCTPCGPVTRIQTFKGVQSKAKLIAELIQKGRHPCRCFLCWRFAGVWRGSRRDKAVVCVCQVWGVAALP
jgi:hypothetical protein